MFDADSSLSTSAHQEITTLSLNVTSLLVTASNNGSSVDGGNWLEEEGMELDGGARYVIEENVRIFNSAIFTLSRFSEHLHFEPTTTGLSLNALTASHSAFGSIYLNPSFFTHLDISQIRADEYNICRLSMRSALTNFNAFAKWPSTAYQLQIDPHADVMVVKSRMEGEGALFKSAMINLRECAATYRHLFNDKTQLQAVIGVAPSVLIAILPKIGTDGDEMKIIATADSLVLERYVRNSADRSHSRKTQAAVTLESLELYVVQQPTEVCLPMKEFKAVLLFADQAGLSVSIHFDSQPGRPIIIAVEENIDFAAQFTLGTLPRHSNGLEPAPARRQPQPTAPQPPTTSTPNGLVEDMGSASNDRNGGDDDQWGGGGMRDYLLETIREATREIASTTLTSTAASGTHATSSTSSGGYRAEGERSGDEEGGLNGHDDDSFYRDE